MSEETQGTYARLAAKKKAEQQIEVATPETTIQDVTTSVETSRRHDVSDTTLIEKIRLIVKEKGNSTGIPLRTSDNENMLLEDVIYTLKRKFNIVTTKTEVARIALNFVLLDFQENKKDSTLMNVLESLRA